MKPRLLDLFCSAGGAAKGYQMAGFYVVGVDNKPQPRYCGDEFHQGDALDYCREHGHEFAAIHASPPCQAYTSLKSMWNSRKHADLIPQTRDTLKSSGVPYVIENVPGAPLLAGWKSIILCGTMFGLTTADGTAELRRHRLFELSFYPGLVPECRHNGVVIGVYGGHGRDRRRSVGVWGHAGGSSKRGGLQAFSTKQRGEAMGISWMSGSELSQAIPPAYTFWLGTRLIRALTAKDTK